MHGTFCLVQSHMDKHSVGHGMTVPNMVDTFPSIETNVDSMSVQLTIQGTKQ